MSSSGAQNCQRNQHAVAHDEQQWRNRLAAPAALGLPSSVFFSSRTAALLAPALAAAVDRRRFRDYAWIAALGTLFGLPAVVRVLWLHARAPASAWARLHVGVAVPRFALHPAHFGIVADVRDALPLLTAALRRSRSDAH